MSSATLIQRHERLPMGRGGLFYGVYPALVVDVKDPSKQGRVKVRLPWAPDPNGPRFEVWARLATMMAGNDRGSWFVPDPDDEVLVAFAGGDPRSPYILGALWNGSDAPPQQMDGSGKNDVKKLRSRNGVTITLDDTQGQEKLILETPAGQKITLQDGPGQIEVEDSNGNTVTLNSSGVTVQSSGTVNVQASTLTVTASSVSINSSMSTFSGTIQAQTVISSSIVGSSYTPGAGNIL
jgi:filamentous hemagglutinin family protein